MRLILSLMLVSWVLAFPAKSRADYPVLRVSYAGRSLALTTAEIAAMPHQDVSAMDAHEKQRHTYSGVPVRTLLAQAGAPFGEKLRGPGMRLAVVARSKDGYGVVFALTEFDEAFNDRTILLVDKQDGQALVPGQGPIRLVVPGDKRPARWLRMLTSLEILSVGDAPAH
jgi:hypothetical protein